jgi:hypothetical protein
VPFDNTAGSSTTLFLANPGEREAMVDITVRSEAGGEVARERAVTLPPRGYTAIVADRRLASTVGRRGVLELAFDGGQLLATGLRFRDSGLLTLPAFAGAGIGSDRGLPHLIFGGDWQTVVTLTNSATIAQEGSVRFWQAAGTPFGVTFTGDEVRREELSRQIGAGGSLQLVASGDGGQVAGWMENRYPKAVSGFAVVERKAPATGAGASEFHTTVPAGTTFSGKLAVPFDGRGSTLTRVALVNLEDAPTEIEAVVFDPLGRFPRILSGLRLAGLGQRVFQVDQQFEELAGQQGILEFRSRQSHRLTGSALRLGTGGAVFLPASER